MQEKSKSKKDNLILNSINFGSKNVLILFLVFINTVSNGFAQSNTLSGYKWKTVDIKADVRARHESSTVEYEGKFYLVGGRGMNTVNVF